MRTINFTENFNGKLGCTFFTAIRLQTPARYVVGETYKISLNGKIIKHAKLIDKRNLSLAKINNYIAWLDAGYNAEQLKNMMRIMYKNKTSDLDKHPLEWLMLQTHNISQTQLNFKQ